MSFTFKKTDTFKHRVEVVVPSDDPDKPHKGSFIATSKRYTKERFNELIKAEDGSDNTSEFIRQTLVKVEGFDVEGVDPNDQNALRETLIEDLALSSCYVREYAAASASVAEKNSPRSSRR